jgi:hypothetical protein
MIRLLLPKGFVGRVGLSRKGNDSGPRISSRCGLWTLDPPRLADPPPRPSPARGEGEERLAFSAEDTVLFLALTGTLAASPYSFVPAYFSQLTKPSELICRLSGGLRLERGLYAARLLRSVLNVPFQSSIRALMLLHAERRARSSLSDDPATRPSRSSRPIGP